MESVQVLRYRNPPKRGQVKSKVFKGLKRKLVRIFHRKILQNYDADRSASYSNDSGFLDVEEGDNNEEEGNICEFPLSLVLEEHSLLDVKHGDLDEVNHDAGYYASCSSGTESSGFADVKEVHCNDSLNVGNSASYLSDVAEISSTSVIREDHGKGNQETPCNRECSMGKVAFGWIFVVSNFVLELVSIVTDQMSSVHKPQYALVGMLMSLLAMIICICELIYKGRKERVRWRWKGRIPWFYYPSPSNLHFGNFADMVGLACAIPQLIATVVNYSFSCRHANNPIKISFWPVIFAFCLLCSKFFENPNKQALSPG